MKLVPYEVFSAVFCDFRNANDEELCKRPWPRSYNKSTTWEDVMTGKAKRYEERRRLVAGEELSRWCSFEALNNDVESYGLGIQLSHTCSDDVKILTDVWAVFSYSAKRTASNRFYVAIYLSTAHWNGTKWRLGPTWKSHQDHALHASGVLRLDFKKEFDGHRDKILGYTKPLQEQKRRKDDAIRAKKLKKYAEKIDRIAAKLRAQAKATEE